MIPRDLEAQLRELRRDLHRHPELGFAEHRTQQVIRTFLERHGYAPRACARTGLVADLPGRSGDFVALRADIDCLPMPETTDLPHRSVHDGRAHKCGHDGHTAILLGVAAALAAGRDALARGVRLLFQPAEEGLGGARVMIDEGALDGVTEVYGLHNWPPFPFGEVRTAAGPVMAAVDTFEVTVTGAGGHASEPHRCRDPIPAAAAIVTTIQTLLARGLSIAGGAVVTVTQVHAGTTHNVTPATARLQGTIRTLDRELRAGLHQRLHEAVRGVGAAHGVAAELEIQEDYPVLVNDRDCAEVVRRAAQAVGAGPVSGAGLPIAAAEDFAFFAAARPAAFFLLGAGRGAATPGCHHPDFDFADDLIPIGVRLFQGIVAARCG